MHNQPIQTEVDFTKPLMLRNETPFTLMGTNFRGTQPVQGYAGDATYLCRHYADGRYNCDGTDSPLDIVNVPEKIVGYVNIYLNNVGCLSCSRSSADSSAGSDRTACIRIEYTEGQFDE